MWIAFIAFHAHEPASHLLRETQYSIRKTLILLPFLWASLEAQTVENWPAIQEPPVSNPRSGRAPGEGNGKPLQYSCLENPMDRGIWWATVHGAAKESDTTEWLTFYRLPLPISFLCQACEAKEREMIFHISPRTINPESETPSCPSIHQVTLFLFLEPHFEGKIQEHYYLMVKSTTGLPWWLSSKENTWNAEDTEDIVLIPGLGRFPGGGHGNPLQYSWVEKHMDRGVVGFSP